MLGPMLSKFKTYKSKRSLITVTDVTSFVKEIIEGQGFVVIPEVLSKTQAEEARSTVLKFAELEREKGKLLIDGKRERLYGLIYKGKIFELMLQYPKVLEIIEAILGEDMTLGGLLLIFSTQVQQVWEFM